MKIKSKTTSNVIKQVLRGLSRKKKKFIIVFLGIVLLLSISLGSIALGMNLFRTGKAFDVRRFVLGIYEENFAVIPNYINSIFSTPERIVIDVKFKDFQKLANRREQAIEQGTLFASPEDYVPAEIRYQDSIIKTKIRLKGDGGDHWKDAEKWSFRVQVSDDKTIFGMRQFSIQRPITRSFLNEWYFHKLLAFNNLISLRFDFIDVTLNGKHLGIYALEEHFDKRLIENNQYREGVIVRFDEDLLWYENPPNDYSEVYSQSAVDAFQTGSIESDETLLQQFKQAKNLLESFRRGILPASDVFDIKKMARLFAIVDLTGHHHATGFSNIRFYYNPITSSLEPIGYDNQIIETLGIESGEVNTFSLIRNRKLSLANSLFDDNEFMKEYIKALEIVSDKDFLDKFFKETEEEYKDKLSILHKSYPWYQFKFTPTLYKNQEFIRNILNPPRALRAHFKEFDFFNARIVLELGNTQLLPLKIIDISYKGETFFNIFSETLLNGKQPLNVITFQDEYFFVPAWFQFFDSLMPDMEVRYKILGTDEIKTEQIESWTHLDKDFSKTDFLRKSPNWKSFVFTRTDEQNKTIFIKAGSWYINSDLIFPKGYLVTAEPGVILNLTNSAKIMSYSPLRFKGTEAFPIIIRSTDKTGQGLFVMGSGGKSELEYVFFENLALFREGDWSLTSSVTFYESPVDISYSKFKNNITADDYLNIVRSAFTLENSVFENSFGDAVDLDFAEGSIDNVSFLDIGLENEGGDALDLSGSVVTANYIRINGVGDKGLSVGEESILSVGDIIIQNSNIGIAVKDNSELNIKNAKIIDSKMGVAVFQKKSEFGPATANIDSLENKAETLYLVEKASFLTVNGVLQDSNEEKVSETLYGN